MRRFLTVSVCIAVKDHTLKILMERNLVDLAQAVKTSANLTQTQNMVQVEKMLVTLRS